MSKLLAGNETVLLIPAYVINGIPYLIANSASAAAAPISAPTKSILDSWITVTSMSSLQPYAGGNISGAVRDDLKLGLTDSDKSTSRSIASVGKGESLTFFNFQAQFTLFREGDTSVTNGSTFAMANRLTRAQGIPYVIAHRLGAPQTFSQTTLTTIGEDWSFYYALTGQPVAGYGDGEEQTIGANFVPKNIVNTPYAIQS